MHIVWDEEALREVDAAAEFYQLKQPGLEIRFLDNLEEAASRISHRPYLYRKIEDDLRKCRLPHFPFAIIYRIHDEAIQIIAVMHIRRKPGYWKLRI